MTRAWQQREAGGGGSSQSCRAAVQAACRCAEDGSSVATCGQCDYEGPKPQVAEALGIAVFWLKMGIKFRFDGQVIDGEFPTVTELGSRIAAQDAVVSAALRGGLDSQPLATLPISLSLLPDSCTC